MSLNRKPAEARVQFTGKTLSDIGGFVLPLAYHHDYTTCDHNSIALCFSYIIQCKFIFRFNVEIES